MKYGKLFKKLRDKKGYTSQEVANALHVSRSTYSRYENNLKDVEDDILEGMANFYGTTVQDFIDWNGYINGPTYPENVKKLRAEGKLK